MKKFLILAFVLFLTLPTYCQDTLYTYFDEDWEKCSKGQHTYYGKSFKTTEGLYTQLDYFKNGKLQMIGFYQDEAKEQRHGIFTYFNSKGDTTGIHQYKDGVKEGKHIDFFENGMIDVSTNFKDGLQHGFTQYYNSNGNLSSEGYFDKGFRIGEWKYYDKNGDYLSKEDFIQNYEAVCGYKIEFPVRWINPSKEEYGKEVDGITLDRMFRKGVRSAKGEEKFFALDAICLKRRYLSADDVCYNMGKMDKKKVKKVTSFMGHDFDGQSAFIYTKRGHNGNKLQVLVVAEKKGTKIAQLKFTFEKDIEQSILEEMFSILESLVW